MLEVENFWFRKKSSDITTWNLVVNILSRWVQWWKLDFNWKYDLSNNNLNFRILYLVRMIWLVLSSSTCMPKHLHQTFVYGVQLKCYMIGNLCVTRCITFGSGKKSSKRINMGSSFEDLIVTSPMAKTDPKSAKRTKLHTFLNIWTLHLIIWCKVLSLLRD
jgi:hypothetical protein